MTERKQMGKGHSKPKPPPPAAAVVNHNPPMVIQAHTVVVQGELANPVPLTGRAKALLIGINYVGQSGQLMGCVNDAKNMRRHLIERWQFPKDQIKLLIDEDHDPVEGGRERVIAERSVSKDQEHLPTKDNILKGLIWLVQRAKRGDHLFLHYSGHGGYTPDDEKDEESDGQDETLYPVDYAKNGQIRDDDLRRYLLAALPAGVRLTCVIDACHSGTMLDLRYRYRVADANHRNFDIAVRDRYKANLADVFLWSGCMDEQTSADTVEDSQHQGAMTYAFLRAVNELEEYFTLGDLLRRCRTILAEKQYGQIPQLSAGRLEDLDTRVEI